MEGLELRELDVEEFVDNYVERSYGPLDISGERHYTLPVQTVREHVERHGGNFEVIASDQARKGIKAELDSGDWYLEVWNEPDNETRVIFGSGEKDKVRTVYERRIDKLAKREEGLQKAVELLVDGLLPQRTDGRSELEVLSDQLEDMDGGPREVASEYVGGEINRPYDVLVAFCYFFELKPGQKISDNFHTLEREIPAGSTDTKERRMKKRYWLERYLREGVKAGLEKYPAPENVDSYLRNFWLGE